MNLYTLKFSFLDFLDNLHFESTDSYSEGDDLIQQMVNKDSYALNILSPEYCIAWLALLIMKQTHIWLVEGIDKHNTQWGEWWSKPIIFCL